MPGLGLSLTLASERRCYWNKPKKPCEPAEGFAVCDRCGEEYARCSAHGGEAGARRSLHAHRPHCPEAPR